MPQFFIEAPTGVRSEAKQKMMKEITAAIDAAYHIPDVRIWLREYAPDQVAQDGRLAAEPIRPLCFLEAPELASLDAKRRMAAKIHTAIAEAYDGIANTEETLILMNHYPLENAGWAGRLQSDNADIVEAMAELNG
ncbi:tautomerase family protein [Nonomuraea dietziae]|uniref:Phenylpyruvate tautomerase PptA (4-oxalocrotonate tautomerase family) n=1 Tax=Nonomuraea dietziae TaxID=65515 RepID=A0A7W5V6M6_9ACTN|nr:N-acetylmuramic acid 6-phosphate etherase [Nonomuraea dietziae]MBB3726010.1 phenylpyruvate tautomerase PptA (4-oxalocrotonate tautomerase family) [Nonomuraea dietziae]